MPAINKTSLGLNQWLGNEYPKRIDFVEDNKIIDDELIKRVKYTDVATDTTAGIVTLNTISDKIKLEAPKPDQTPYIPFSKGYRTSSNRDFVLRANLSNTWTPSLLDMYSSDGSYVGTYHTNGGRAYYKVPNRNGGNWCEIMDNHDMAARDNRMNVIDGNVNAARGRADDAWNRTQHLYDLRNQDNNDKWQNYIRDIRLAGFMELPLWGANTSTERGGYVVTGIRNHDANSVLGTGDYAQLRALQFFRNGQWLNIGCAQKEVKMKFIVDRTEAKQFKDGMKYIAIFDKDNKDWYEELKKFKTDTLKVMYNKETYLVLSTNKEASFLAPTMVGE